MSIAEELLVRQNSDGGWSYSNGGSWTEPTCYALLALRAEGATSGAEIARAVSWLARCQRSDGGFAPRESVRESTWVTALVLLLPEDLRAHVQVDKAVRRLVEQSGRESGWVFRLRLLLMGTRVDESIAFDGWPWYPDAAAWIGPTALSVLALQKANRRGTPNQAIETRLEKGRDFLYARRCRDGGWNHGSTRALGYDSDSYPETTGLALLALGAAPTEAAKAAEIERGLARAEALLAPCQSSEAVSWLSLGLSAHGRVPTLPKLAPRDGASRSAPSQSTTMELALSALADAALRGNNLFLNP